MKLDELAALDEIQKIPQITDHGIDLANVKDVKLIKDKYLDKFYIEQGKYKDYLVFMVRDLEGDRTNGHKLIAMLVCQEIDDLKTENDHKPVMVLRTWCEEGYRNKGIVTNLYQFLHNTLKFAILSDVRQTPETVSIWDKMRKIWPAKMINLDTGETQEIDDKLLYDTTKRFVIIIERQMELPVSSPFFKVTQAPSGILEDYRFNMDGL